MQGGCQGGSCEASAVLRVQINKMSALPVGQNNNKNVRISLCAGFWDFLVGRCTTCWRGADHYEQVKRNAEGEEIPAEPSLQEIHDTVTQCLEQPLSMLEETTLDLAYSTLPLAADRSDVKVPCHRFEENWIEFLRKSTLGDGVDILDRLVVSEGQFGTQQQLLADITKCRWQASVECTHLSTMSSSSVHMQLSIPKRCLLTSSCTLHTARKSLLKPAYVSCKDVQNVRAKLWMLCGSLNGH